jgi:RNA polymerase sigma factor (sigma-70 family)
VEDRDWLVERFEAHRPRLRSVAYRMLGSAGEADDAVQEAWFRLSRADTGDVDNLGGWLTTVVARVCLDMLRSRGSRREEPWTSACPTRSWVTGTVATPSARPCWARGSGWRCWWSWTP